MCCRFPQDVLQALRSVTRQTLENEAEKDPEFKRVYESYIAFQKAYQPWHGITSKALQAD